jgi:hypothetical protein
VSLSDLLDEIDSSGASDNVLFRLASDETRRAVSPGVLGREWYPVTRAYGLSLGVYIGALARVALEVDETRPQWEEALLVPTRLFGEEMHWGISGRGGIHHNLFRDLELTWGTAPTRRSGCETAREALVDSIRNALGDPFVGAGAILVIERTAPRIVETFSRIVRTLGMNPKENQYLEIHSRIEPAHGREAERLVEILLTHLGGEPKVASGIRDLSLRLGEYWDRVGAEVFG